MCGIFCDISYGTSSCDVEKNKQQIKQDKEILKRITQRGPDWEDSKNIDVNDNITVSFYGAVLWMQGNQLTPQPIEDKYGVLLYNGDIFDETWNTNISDTQTIMNMLSKDNNHSSNQDIYREDHIVRVLRSLTGPFSLIYYDKDSQILYFTRDRIGRSSLLFFMEKHDRIILSNVMGKTYEGCLEVPAENIFSLNIAKRRISMYTWTGFLGSDIFPLNAWFEIQTLKQIKPDDEFCFYFDKNMDLGDNENIISFIENSAKEHTDKLTVMTTLLGHEKIGEVVSKVTKLLEDSVHIRVKRQPQKCKECIKNNIEMLCEHCPIGILFSGGLDCTILALLVDKFLPKDQKVDLINVAFRKNKEGTFDVPDRLTGIQSYEELKKLCPNRFWEFKEVNVSKEELEEYQNSTIADLVYPRKTILDESLGSALWFAARGKASDDTTSSCRVLFLGSGADELFGGYTRHRNAFRRTGWTGLAQELMLDWKRISIRNLSRDNRVICDHGRQPRLPYLDENFSKYVLELKPWFKCFPSQDLGPGVGDKLLLRLVALNLGLSDVVLFPKRALQFGSRIANKKERGSDISKSFINKL